MYSHTETTPHRARGVAQWSSDETKEAPQCRFHGVSEVLETTRIHFVATKLIPPLSPPSFMQNADVPPY